MRYEDWTYQETEVRLAEHSELRRALGLRLLSEAIGQFGFIGQVAGDATSAPC